MDTDVLQLKPFVTIDTENAETDFVREDKAIRPYLDQEQYMSTNEDSHRSEMACDDSDLESDTCISNSSRRNRTITNVEENRQNKVPVYKRVIIRDNLVSCGVVVIDEVVYFERKVTYECIDKIVWEEADEPETENSWMEDLKLEVKLNNTCEFACESSTDSPNHEDDDLHPTLDPLGLSDESTRKLFSWKDNVKVTRKLLQNLLAELANKSQKGVSKVSGKRQRRKKLHDILGPFYTFHDVDPPQVSIFVFPVSKQNIVLGQGSNQQDPSEPSSSQPPREQRQWPPESIYDRPWAAFCQELYRLGTFMDMSSDFPVFALRLARSGFVCLPEGAIVCYFCGVQRNQWNSGDSPEEIHRQLNPSCSMITGVKCNNVPVNTVSADQSRAVMEIWSLSGPTLSSQNERNPAGQILASTEGGASFLAHQVTSSANLPRHRPAAELHGNVSEDAAQFPEPSHSGNQGTVPASNQSSATAATTIGLQQGAVTSSAFTSQNLAVSTTPGSTTKGQASWSLVISNQQLSGSIGGTTSDANPERAGNSTVSRILDGTAQPEVPSRMAQSPPTARQTDSTGQQVVTYQQLGIITDAPKNSAMATVNARVGTFSNWPSTHPQTPTALAEAGFYYAGYADCGRCFQCGGGLKNWEPTDNPWVEHARYFGKCAYVRQFQGQDFVNIVSELNETRQRQPISMDQVREKMRRLRAGGDHIHEPAVDPSISTALSMGFSQEAVDTAVQRLRTDGHPLTADRLIDCLEEDGALAAGDVEAVAEEGNIRGQVEELVAENSEIRQQRLCKICLDREVCVLYLPCGHLVCCPECAPALRACPVCRQTIKGRIRAFPV